MGMGAHHRRERNGGRGFIGSWLNVSAVLHLVSYETETMLMISQDSLNSSLLVFNDLNRIIKHEDVSKH